MSSIQAVKVDLLIRRFRTWEKELHFADVNGNDMNLTDYDITAEVRQENDYDSTRILKLNVNTDNAATGDIKLYLSEDETGAISPTNGYWDLLFTYVGPNPLVQKETWVYGMVEVKESITHV